MKKKYLLLLPFLTFAMSTAACNNANVDSTPSTVAVTGVKLDQSSITLDVGDTKQLKATVEPENATDKTVSWTVGDSSIASVRDGLVSALAKGSTVVTVTASTFTAQCNVTVNEKAVAPTLSSITVTGYKERYELNEALSIVVKAQYSDRTEKTLAATEYQVTGFDSGTAGSKTVVVSYQGKQQTFTVEVVRPAEKVIASIAIAQEPTKKEYQLNQTLDLRGLKVVATYTDGTSAEIFNYGNSQLDSSTPGEKTITISAGEKTATFKVTVIAPVVTLNSIAVTHQPTKTTYVVGEVFSKDGLEVTAKYSDNSTQVVTQYTLSTPDMSAAGTKTITVTYQDKTTTFSILVKNEEAPVLQGINIDTTNVKKAFVTNETFEYTGLVVTAKYNKGSDQVLNPGDYQVSTPDMTAAGTKTVTVTYQNKNATYQITVSEPQPELLSIILDSSAVKKSYYVNDQLDLTGLIVKAHYSAGEDVTLTDSQYNVEAVDMSTAGTKTVVISYQRQRNSFEIQVAVKPVIGIKSIAVTQMPNKVNYVEGEQFDPTGLVITATYTNDTTAPLGAGDYQLSNPNMATAGEKTIEVAAANGMTTSFKITVVEAAPVLQSLILVTDEVKKAYYVNDTLDLDGLVVKAHYNKGDDVVLQREQYEVQTPDMTSTGKKDVVISYQNKQQSFEITISEQPEVTPDYVLHYKKGAANWTDVQMIVNPANENEYMLANEIQFDVDDQLVFHMTGDDWRKHSELKNSDDYDCFKALDNGDIAVKTAGKYQFYVNVAKGNSIIAQKHRDAIGLEAQYDGYAFKGKTLDTNNIKVFYKFDDDTVGHENIANQCSYYVMDNEEKIPVDEHTVIDQTGTLRVYVSKSPFEDTYFEVNVAYEHFVHYQVGEEWFDKELDGRGHDYATTVIELAQDAHFALCSDGEWLDNDGAYGYVDHNVVEYIGNGSEKTFNAKVAGKVLVGAGLTEALRGSAICYDCSWEFELNRNGNKQLIEPTASINLQFEYKFLELEEGDIITISRHGRYYGYDYICQGGRDTDLANNREFKWGVTGDKQYFEGYDGENSYLVKAGQSGIYSFYLVHEDFDQRPDYHTRYDHTPSLSIVKEDIWHSNINGEDDVVPENPYNDEEVALRNIDLKKDDKVKFNNLKLSAGYSNIADAEEKAHFTEGAENALVVKDAGTYNFFITRATGAIRVEYYTEEFQEGFERDSFYVVGSAAYVSGTSAEGASWDDAAKAFEMEEVKNDIPEGFAKQYKATIKFNKGDEWRVRTNIYLDCAYEDAGAFDKNEYMKMVDANVVVNKTGTYDIYLKIAENGYWAVYVSKSLDITVDKESVEVIIDKTVDVQVTKSDGTPLAALNTTSSDNSIATAACNLGLAKVTITGKAEGNATITITDGETSAVVKVRVGTESEIMPDEGFGIIFADGVKFAAGVDEGIDGDYHQYQLHGYHFQKDEQFKLYNFERKEGWVDNIDGWSFGGASAEDTKWEEYLEKGAEYYAVKKDFYADMFIKLKAEGNNIYFGLDRMSVDKEAVNVAVAGEANIKVSDWMGAELTVTSGDNNVATVAKVDNNGNYTITGVAAGSTTITVTDGILTKTVNVTVTEPQPTKEITVSLGEWTGANAEIFAWVWGEDVESQWIKVDTQANKLVVPTGVTGLKLARMPAGSETGNWNTAWNQSGDLAYTPNKTLTFVSWDGNFEWR